MALSGKGVVAAAAKDNPVHIIGGGLAGCEAAWQCARRGQAVIIHEMRPHRPTPAHQGDRLAELVCSNSFRSDDAEFNAVGLLHEELRQCGSLIMACGDRARVPAGGALAVDREEFAQSVTAAIEAHPLITIRREEVTDLAFFGDDHVIVASGPLTSDALGEEIRRLTGIDALAFFDAIAPIVHRDSIDFDVAWYQSRYDKNACPQGLGDGKDYINLPLDRVQYGNFVAGLLAGEVGDFKAWERDTPYFEACLPIEVMAERGPETLRFGPMKPVGLTNPHAPQKPYAVVQLRQDNRLGTLYNMVGFQTKLKHGAQSRLFRTLPGLAAAEFARLGGIHRNSFINSPRLLDESLCLRAAPRLRFAGQITGVEGYVESAAIGFLAGLFAAGERGERPLLAPPCDTALGALLGHITGGADAKTFQPMNVNFGLFPPLEPAAEAALAGKGKQRGRSRKQAMSRRALDELARWLRKAALPPAPMPMFDDEHHQRPVTPPQATESADQSGLRAG